MVNFKSIAKDRGVSYQNVADFLGVNYQTVSRWVNESTHIGLRDAEAIRDHFFPEVPIEYLYASEEASS